VLQDGPVVSSYNEWDPLEEVIVGVVEGACVPPWDAAVEATMPEEHHAFFQSCGGRPFPPEEVAAAAAELEGFAELLREAGIIVRRPDRRDFSVPFSTPNWSSPSGVYAAMPRDALLVVGDQIIEAPMAWRSRYFETFAYRNLLREYSERGARWCAAPRPELDDRLYAGRRPDDGRGFESVISEFEPTFDAADFIRCGRDVFAQLSHVTNRAGVRWLARHLGSEHRVQVLDLCDSRPMHVDASLMPLAPGRLLVNPDRVRTIPEPLLGWEILMAPRPCATPGPPLRIASHWLSMNVLSLDHRRVVVEAGQTTMIEALAGWGFEPIACPLRNFHSFGGSFHCATLDVRRRGGLESYCAEGG
jgi:glycine amidinotransferase